MAEFHIKRLEGTRFVEIHLDYETVRVEAGALSYLAGDIQIHSRVVPSLGSFIRAVLADEAVFRPTYSGKGVITLESTLGGFHILDLDGETWILERGAYWASEGSVDVGYHREPLKTSFWMGEGLIYLQTCVRGVGRVVLTTRGPVEEVQLEPGEQIVADGKQVVARTGDVSFTVRRPTKNWLGRFTSGEGWVRVYQGTGRLLLNPAPYWRYRVFSEHGRGADLPARATT